MWLQKIEKAFVMLGSNEEQKVILDVYQLQGSTYDLWLKEKRKIEPDEAEGNHEPYTWAKFKKTLVKEFTDERKHDITFIP